MSARTRIVHDGSIRNVCDRESTRYALGAVHVTPSTEPGEVYLAATDGRILAVVKAEGDCTDPANPPLIPAEILPKSAKERKSLYWDHRQNEPEQTDRTKAIELNGTGRWETPFGRWAQPTEGRFPKYVDILPPADNVMLTVSLDARLLKSLSDALTDAECPSVTLILCEQCDPRKATQAIGVVGSRGIGVIMPMSRETDPVAQYEAFRAELQAAHDAAKAAPVEQTPAA